MNGFRGLCERAPTGLLPQLRSFTAFAERHHAVIEQFGRFPHRNALQGRESTAEELRYLAEGGETFSA